MIKTKISSVFLAVAVMIAAVAFSGCMESETKPVDDAPSYDDAAWLDLYNNSSEELDGGLLAVADLMAHRPITGSNWIKIRSEIGKIEKLANSTLARSKEYSVSPELDAAKKDYEVALTKFASFGNVGQQGITEMLDRKTGTASLTFESSLNDFEDGLTARKQSKNKIANFTGTAS